ncbi:stalk domain-containing protein [Paenibacillus arenosi]|uniref:Copper amine oxidase-like N-terminal domain-containing protein n=1 Tax=Paenibacillus arenosi TaxID=2774142 RepID=A0ABR9AZZ5_9BACL|nr:stalk domain-containing protein [Paenibacillus arenosi]MBD8499705.1 hypothetical protein [Paenibacillus arenosi]
MRRRITIGMLLVFVLAFPSLLAAAEKNKSVEIELKYGSNNSYVYEGFRNNGIDYVPMNQISSDNQLTETYRVGAKTYESLLNVQIPPKSDVFGKFTAWEKDIVFRVGKNYVRVNGSYIKLKGTPFVHKGTFYAPLAPVLDALEIKTTYDKKTKVYKVDTSYTPTFDYASKTYNNMTYRVDYKTGRVHVTDKKGRRKLLTTLDEPIHKRAEITFKKTPKGHVILNIFDDHGEPSINMNKHMLLLKNDKLIHKTLADYHKRYEDNIEVVGSTIFMTNGKKLNMISDETGKIVKTVDLVALGGVDDQYFVPMVGEDYILIRPMEKGLLTLVYFDNKEKVLLYKEFLNKQEQEYAEMNDVPYHGDYLEFVKQEGNKLYFKNKSNLIKEDKTLYTYTLK